MAVALFRRLGDAVGEATARAATGPGPPLGGARTHYERAIACYIDLEPRRVNEVRARLATLDESAGTRPRER